MALQVMTVCEQGMCKNVAQLPYEFYAQSGSNTPECVKIVMPFGGRETGFYRYPKIGEKVLVDDNSKVVMEGGGDIPIPTVTPPSEYYLMGYLPSATEAENNFLTNTKPLAGFDTEIEKLQNEEGMVLRYKQTGKDKEEDTKDPAAQYSEIGFYHRETQWKASEDDKSKYKDVNDKGIPAIDHLNIQSTGDIRTTAENYHQTKAKRIEILSNVNESDFSQDLKGENRPFGDKGSDISNLLQGDIHIRGNRRIILKAGSEIRLEVGRSTIVISDAGIILTSRKTHSAIHNSLDTILSVLPRDGITMFGQHLKLAAAYDWAITENMGSSIKGTAGIMRLEGKDIKASTISGAAYITNFVAQNLAFVDNLVSMSVGTHDSDNTQDSKVPAYAGMGVGVAGILFNIGIGLKYPATGAIDDPDSKIVKYTVIALQLMSTVIGVIEMLYINPEDQKAKDALALAGIIAEWICLMPIFIVICLASAGPFMLHNDSVHLGNNGDLTLLGAKIKNFTVDAKVVNSPLSGFNKPPENEDQKWSKKLSNFAKANWKLLTFGVIAAVVGGVVGGVGLNQMNSLTSDKEKLLEELNAL
jgi:hypothetical protein